MAGVTYRRADRTRGGGPGALAVGAALIAGLLFVGGAVYVSLLGSLQSNNNPSNSPLGAIDTPLSSLPIFIQPTPTPTPTPSPSPTLPWYLTPSPTLNFGSPSYSPSASPSTGIPAPNVNFRGSIQSDGLTVVWTDKSTGDITSWLWDFGDGYGSTQQNPHHQYGSQGDYNVTLTVTGPGGSGSKTKVLHLIPAPTAAFNCAPPSGLTVKCDASSSTGQIDNYAWDWGDGSTEQRRQQEAPQPHVQHHRRHDVHDHADRLQLRRQELCNTNGARDRAAPTPPPVVTPPSAPPTEPCAGPHGGQRQPGGTVRGAAGRAGDAVGRDVTRRFGRAALTPRAGRAPRRGSNIRA